MFYINSACGLVVSCDPMLVVYADCGHISGCSTSIRQNSIPQQCLPTHKSIHIQRSSYRPLDKKSKKSTNP